MENHQSLQRSGSTEESSYRPPRKSVHYHLVFILTLASSTKFERIECSLQIKMSLQLYQVDHKSYLLDFKSLSEEATNPVVEERRERLLGKKISPKQLAGV